ncbi:unnamed protein product [Cylindrotheca closterium]|uniref:Uncharacterized protein n=1 Tax=Cylindrotheca closterium TaxID=2856 RepID=A0AAD2CKP9_9STRA|nr:unnamed protein product [Cylindrotheca closterium]
MLVCTSSRRSQSSQQQCQYLQTEIPSTGQKDLKLPDNGRRRTLLFVVYHNSSNDNECDDDCASSQAYWGTPEVLRDFGMVEPLPHTFYLGDTMTFVIWNATLGTKEPALDNLSIEYMNNNYPSFQTIDKASKSTKLKFQKLTRKRLLHTNST